MALDRKKLQAIQDRLESIRAKHDGRLTPEDVVKDAKSVKSPLHDRFPWDDKTAAHERRLDIARTLIRSIRVEVRTEKRDVVVPMYVRDPEAAQNEQGYTSLLEIKSDETVAKESLTYEFRRAISALERAVDIGEVLGIGDEVTKLINRIEVLQDHVLV